MIDRRYILYFDWLAFGLTLAICSLGLAFVFSATTTSAVVYSSYFKKQLGGMCAGIIIYFFFCFFDYRKLCRAGYFLYFLVIGLLLFTLIKGKIGMGAQRWIDLKIVRFQPSEIAKLFFPAFVTYYLYTENDAPVYHLHSFAPILGVLLVSSLLILKQPDLGTALVFLFSGLCMFWLAGIGKKFFSWGLLVCMLTAPLGWAVLKPYQKKRILVFLGEGDTKKERYHIEQSKIAIGSGTTTGKGFCQGTQNKLLFLPESRTDFIFAVIGEEWGLMGTLLVILLYLLLSMRLLYKILVVPMFFAQLLAVGLYLPIIFSAGINIAMVCGMLPVVGIPLPLMSYGVTSVWITMAALGWIQGITTRLF